MDFRHETVLPNEDLPFRMFIFEGKDGNYKVTRHWHRSVEIFLVLEGSIDFYINSSRSRLMAGDYVIVNSNEIHSIDCPDPNITIVLQIPSGAFGGYMDEGEYLTFSRKGEAEDERLKALVTEMFQVYEKRGLGYELKVKSCFYDLLYLLVTELSCQDPDKEHMKTKRHLDRLSEVTAYMKEHYHEELSLQEVAARFGFTPSYLSRIFKQYAQVNYRTYLIDLRVKYALREMLNSDIPLGELAMKHGFPDSRSFSKAFLKRYGCLPSQYRKSKPAYARPAGGGDSQSKK